MNLKYKYACALGFIAATLVAGCLNGCKPDRSPGPDLTTRLDPPAPETVDIQKGITTNSQSQIGFSLGFPHQRIRELVESNIPKRFDSGGRVPQEWTHWLVDDYYTYWFERGPISLNFTDSGVTFEVPVKGQAEGGGNIKIFGIKKHAQETADINGKIVGSMTLSVGTDYSITAIPQFSLRLERADATLFTGNKIGLKTIVYDAFNSRVPTLAQNGAKRIAEEFALRSKMEDAWSKLTTVKSISSQPPTWLLVSPSELRMRPITFATDPVSVSSAIIANTVVQIQDAEPARKMVGPLPGLVFDPNLNNKVSLQIPVQVSLDSLSYTLNSALEGKTTNVEDLETTISYRSVRLFTMGPKIVFAIDIEASNHKLGKTAEGTLYLIGNLTLLPDSKIAISDLDFDIKTHDFLVRTADWLLHKSIVNAVKEGAQFDAQPILDKARAELNEEVKNVSLDGKIKLTLVIENVSIADLKVARSQAFVMFNVNGTSVTTLE